MTASERPSQEPADLLAQARAAAGSGRLDEAEKLFRSALDSVQADKRSGVVLELVGLRRSRGDLGQAEALLRAALEAAPDDESNPLLVELADLVAEQDRTEEAGVLLRQVVARAPEDIDAAVYLAGLMAGQGRTEEAEALLRQVVARAPEDITPVINLADLVAGQGRTEEAEALLRQVVARAPEDVSALTRLADLVQHRGDSAEARELRDRANRLGDLRATPEARGDDPPIPPASNVVAEDDFDLVALAAGDLPAKKDLLGFAPLVDALHALLDDPKTTLPLAIAVTAPWGAGKSSVMRQLGDVLDATLAFPDQVSRGRRWKTVRFDAWKYERSERLWAALVKSVYDQAQEPMTLRGKLAFRARLERRRLGWWKLIGISLAPLLVVAATVTAALTADLSKQETALAGLSGAAIVLGAATRYGAMIVNPFRRAIEKHAKRPDYEAQLGFTAQADREIRHLVSLLAPDAGHGLAIFVDDLDRCSSAHVVEVVEAMNQIFNASEDHHCVFILGLDRDVVATNINVAYAETVAQLKSDGNPLGDQFGSEFLAKLVQLSVAIPQPDASKIADLMSAITGTARLEEAVAEDDVQRAQDEIREKAPDETPASVESAAAEIAAGAIPAPAVDAAKHRERARRIKDSPAVVAAEFAALEFLEPNPRQVKRFHNAFRLQLYVASEDDRVTFDFSQDQLVALARWVALRLRWPQLADAIAREPGLLTVLEGIANKERTVASLDEDVRTRHAAWIRNQAALALIRESNEACRLSALRLDKFVRIA